MRKYLLLLLVLMLALACTAAAEDEEVSIADVLNNAHPDVVEKTIVQPPTEEEIAENPRAASAKLRAVERVRMPIDGAGS